MFKQLLAKISKCRGEDEMRGRHVYTEERIDALVDRLLGRLESLEDYMKMINKEHAELKKTLEELYKQNLILVKKYGKKDSD